MTSRVAPAIPVFAGARRRFSALVLLPLALILSAGRLSAQTKPAPGDQPRGGQRRFQWLELENHEQPIWVDASATLTADGRFRRELFSPSSLVAVPRASNAEGQQTEVTDAACQRLDAIGDNPFREPDFSEGDLARHARWVAVGSISEITPGFFNGELGSLLTVAVERVVKPLPAGTPSIVYVYYARARAVVDGWVFCRLDSGVPDDPRVGDRILIAPYTRAFDAAGSLFRPRRRQLFLEHAEGGMRVPSGFQTAGVSVDELANRISAARSEQTR